MNDFQSSGDRGNPASDQDIPSLPPNITQDDTQKQRAITLAYEPFSEGASL